MIKHSPSSLQGMITNLHFNSHKPVHFQRIVIVRNRLLILQLDSLLMAKLLAILSFHESCNFGLYTCFDIGLVDKLEQEEYQEIHV